MTRILYLLWLLFISIAARGEAITLYNDNGEGGIHKSTGKLVEVEGQYYVDLHIPRYNGDMDTERLKVYRVKDSARLLLNQDKWAEKYIYVVERRKGFLSTTPYYFNMRSVWKPSLTEDPDDPGRIIPVKKLTAYRQDLDDSKNAFTVVLVKMQGKYMIYYGDVFFLASIKSNSKPLDYAAPWTRNYKYRTVISGFNVYFNIK